jgi:hypothetical protein
MSFRAGLLSCLVLCGCQSAPVEPRPAASAFVQTLNAKNVAGMTALAAIPFRYRNQPWESAPDGSGFVLGKTEDRVANSAEELRALLQGVTPSVQIEDAFPVANPPSKADLLGGTLKGAPSQWSEMNLVLFRRGEGDVEHVAIVGVDAKGKVTGLYVN